MPTLTNIFTSRFCSISIVGIFILSCGMAGKGQEFLNSISPDIFQFDGHFCLFVFSQHGRSFLFLSNVIEREANECLDQSVCLLRTTSWSSLWYSFSWNIIIIILINNIFFYFTGFFSFCRPIFFLVFLLTHQDIFFLVRIFSDLTAKFFTSSSYQDSPISVMDTIAQ